MFPVFSIAKTIEIDKIGNIVKKHYRDTVTYIIEEPLNLNKDTLSIPANCVLKFSNNGSFFNGVIIGNNTSIEASKNLIFRDIALSGTWNNKTVYSQWVGLRQGGESNNEQFENLMILCRGLEKTHLYTQEGEYYLNPVEGSSPILVPSNVHWHNSSIIKLKECDYTKYSLVYLNKVENVTIEGGEFIGDLVKHRGVQGEWGHGIKCGGARNVILKNLICKYFWGDGIDLIEGLDSKGQATIICDNILIIDVKCLYNRRQGLSIEAAKNVKVLNSEFSFTGEILKTDPSAGVDIEPWDDNGEKLYNIIIKNCIMSNNKGPDLMIYTPSHLATKDTNKDFLNLSVEDCQMGFAFLSRVSGVDFKRCNVKSVVRVDYSDYVSFDSTTKIRRKVLNENGKNIHIKQ